GQEVNVYGTNPSLADTDGDGAPDGVEVAAGTNPLLATSTPIQPATITLSAASGSYRLLQGAVPLDDSLTVTGGDTFSGATIQIEAGFAPGDTLALTSGIGSITGVYDGTKGILTLSGSGSASAYQSALRAVTFSTTSTSTAEREFKVTLGSAISFGGHYYEYVSGSYTWAQARALALSKTFNGLSGYLANLTSAAENSFVLTKIGADVWIGGSDSVNDGVWKWMDGPEAGITFWNGLSGGSAPSGRFANWNPGEPNNYGGSEDYAQFYVGTGKWNDLPTSSRLGFLVEYGTDAPAAQTFFRRTNIFSNQGHADNYYGSDCGTDQLRPDFGFLRFERGCEHTWNLCVDDSFGFTSCGE
ncbi:hypothetical protein EBS57_09410, partial [bacterium]|nr:hypothetical protein [bacterium]